MLGCLLSESLIALILVMGCDAPRPFVPSRPLPAPLPSRERGLRGVSLSREGISHHIPAAPGIPRSRRSACSRPLTLREGGVGPLRPIVPVPPPPNPLLKEGDAVLRASCAKWGVDAVF